MGLFQVHIKVVSLSLNTNKTLTSDVRISGSIVTRKSSHEPQFGVRFCIDIDSDGAFNHCSGGFSAACETLPIGQFH